MDKAYQPQTWEPIIKKIWEDAEAGKAVYDPHNEPFSVILPPPNANGSLHAGHVMMVYQDIMVRYARQQGKIALWLPGADHAGFETQYVFEKFLAKQGKSRFDYDRETLYRMIAEFVDQSKGTINNQFRSIGFSLDWSKEQYTLNPNIVAVVYETFKKLFNAGLIYRSERLVNYCTKDGTSFSDLEAESTQTTGILYHIRYPLKKGGEIIVATTRPETLFGDSAVMVHPKDKRYKHLVGASAMLPLTNKEIPIIADEYVDMKFGTGAVKVTPAHDVNDFEVGKRHSLPRTTVIGFNGRLCNTGTELDGLKVKPAREAVVAKLQERNLLVKTEEHSMVVKSCYKCGNTLEPLPLEQWYISIKPLAERAKKAIQDKEIEIHPRGFTKKLTRILDDFIDWNISRQIVWGMRIPAFQNQETKEWKVELDPSEQKKLLNTGVWQQDPDTFDTWFSSAQWPFATLISVASTEYKVKSADLYKKIAYETLEGSKTNLSTATKGSPLEKAFDYFTYFYPTSVLETGYDIARAWVARMMMLGYFVTNRPPFKHVYLHGMVRDGKGQKMSKSKGNVIDPLKLTEKYGTDALRMALIFGTTPGNDVNLSDEKVIGMRNFVNKLWNVGRFIQMLSQENQHLKQETEDIPNSHEIETARKELQKEYVKLKKRYIKLMNRFEYSQVLVEVHEFMWHRFADIYIEKLKIAAKNGEEKIQNDLKDIYLGTVDMLSPFAPFICGAIKEVFRVSEDK